jgi:ABC-type dipeptide/oligopeptide/nickel transport system ATPase component
MEITFIKRKKLKKLKAYRAVCRQIREIMKQAKEDEHNNVSSYRWDKAHKEILDLLEDVGLGENTPHSTADMLTEDWEWKPPFKVCKG